MIQTCYFLTFSLTFRNDTFYTENENVVEKHLKISFEPWNKNDSTAWHTSTVQPIFGQIVRFLLNIKWTAVSVIKILLKSSHEKCQNSRKTGLPEVANFSFRSLVILLQSHLLNCKAIRMTMPSLQNSKKHSGRWSSLRENYCKNFKKQQSFANL